jgi:hypothetical protein
MSAALDGRVTHHPGREWIRCAGTMLLSRKPHCRYGVVLRKILSRLPNHDLTTAMNMPHDLGFVTDVSHRIRLFWIHSHWHPSFAVRDPPIPPEFTSTVVSQQPPQTTTGNAAALPYTPPEGTGFLGSIIITIVIMIMVVGTVQAVRQGHPCEGWGGAGGSFPAFAFRVPSPQRRVTQLPN